MTRSPRVSVVIVNRDRLVQLKKTVSALAQQSHRDFQVVLVSNQVERAKKAIPTLDRATCIEFSEANIAKARNLGIAAACGDVIAFCDDDAVPEPQWLDRLVAPFADPEIGAAGGTVRGRNGINVQWGVTEFDRYGNDRPLEVSGSKHPTPSPGFIVKTVGTNCAFRREALVEIGGFDGAYQFYLDETDVNMRLAQKGWTTAIAPLAEIHHGFAESAYRTAERVPKSLYQIGASKAYFCRQHGDPAHHAIQLEQFYFIQHRRLLRMALLGQIDRSAMSRLLSSLKDGFQVGGTRERETMNFPPRPAGSSFTDGPAPSLVFLESGHKNFAHKQLEAAELTEMGRIVTLLHFTPSVRMLRVSYQNPGFWLHSGGIWGRTDRKQMMILPRTRARAIRQELQRIEPQRH